jgi:predicted TIM-barrel fold metal-dependent hydrolase
MRNLIRRGSFMKVLVLSAVVTLLAGYGGWQAFTKTASGVALQSAPTKSAFSDQELSQFIVLEPIDTHTHIYESDSKYYAMLQKLRLHVLDIMVVADNANPERKDLAKESKDVFEVVQNSDGHVTACTTFDAYRLNQTNFASAAIRRLNQNFDQGAIAVKLWKNVGMEIKDAKGDYVLPDDASLEPIYEDIAAHHKTLVTHIADPDTAWSPPNPAAPDYAYFVNNPVWYMYKIPHSPSKAQILDARDHVLQTNPNLRMVGAHLGSMEGDFGQVAQHLDRYPNFAVDLAGRLPYLMLQPRDKMIAFITKYQDRLIYGTDDALYPQADIQQTVAKAEASYASDWRFLATNDMSDYRGQKIQGLALPKSILRKIYHDNAVHWFPGILGKRT